MCYWGVTGFFDAPALANQGTVLATQYSLGRLKLSPMVNASTGAKKKVRELRVQNAPIDVAYEESNARAVDKHVDATPVEGGVFAFSQQLEACVEAPRPFSTLQTMPNAYMGLAKDGFYVPGRINKFKWRLARDQRFFMGY